MELETQLRTRIDDGEFSQRRRFVGTKARESGEFQVSGNDRPGKLDLLWRKGRKQ
jgi:hypothetical protein